MTDRQKQWAHGFWSAGLVVGWGQCSPWRSFQPGGPFYPSSLWCLFTTLLEAKAVALLSEIFEQLQIFLKGGPPAQGQVQYIDPPSRGSIKNMVSFSVSHLRCTQAKVLTSDMTLPTPRLPTARQSLSLVPVHLCPIPHGHYLS